VERGKVPRVCTDLESGAAPVSVCRLVPLPEGNTMKKEVIRRVMSGLEGEPPICISLSIVDLDTSRSP
jgi:hypothetical protein